VARRQWSDLSERNRRLIVVLELVPRLGDSRRPFATLRVGNARRVLQLAGREHADREARVADVQNEQVDVHRLGL